MSKVKRVNKEAEKLRNLSAAELQHQEKEQLDQLFRLKFQMKMGQSESLNKIRTLRRSVARLKTMRRQHELGIHAPATSPKAETQAKVAVKTAAKKSTKTKAAAKKTASKAGKK
jgi:large subunit ribosomal protein L29